MQHRKWGRLVRRIVYWHLASWPTIYLTSSKVLRGNLGAYAKGRIWLAEELEGTTDLRMVEVLHHELFHGKLDAFRYQGRMVAGMSVGVAMEFAGQLAPDLYRTDWRADLLEHYRLQTPEDFEEECLVRLCCDVLLGEAPALPDELHRFCRALCVPLGAHWTFAGGLPFAAPSLLLGVQRWPSWKALPGDGIAAAPTPRQNP
ncbi:hypothetical protein [Leisingera caerulea]|uniref:Uncharacterized protein n=1 Tax=Leisingera caerulea TaxID=506591 RepID=A0A9Q9HMU8_LEICA|nr:hypothetical protein [Leisingera caerulea]UWQ55002.1 hypothetical protein K3721_05565 [Leisingera caerulea]